jgi:undecaprenyl-phosphate 4-deoxy-4-formamido-L-arabinose transferase
MATVETSTCPTIAQFISVVVPVYNSEASLPLLVARLEPVLRSCAERFELLLVNDGSRDGSWKAVERLAAAHAWVRGVNLMRNYGQHNTLLCGIRAARGDLVVTSDDDLQNPPEEIPKLLAKLSEGYDVVYGTPERQRHGLLRDLASLITKLTLQAAIGAETARDVSAFRIFRVQLRDAFSEFRGPYANIDVLLTWATSRFGAVRVRHDSRVLGTSNYTIKQLVVHALNMMTGFSTLPLQVASMVGFGCTLFGILVLVYVVGRYFLQGGSVPGFPFLACIIAIFSGTQLFALGIIGEYLARMHFRMMERPTYAVRSILEASPHPVQSSRPVQQTDA